VTAVLVRRLTREEIERCRRFLDGEARTRIRRHGGGRRAPRLRLPSSNVVKSVGHSGAHRGTSTSSPPKRLEARLAREAVERALAKASPLDPLAREAAEWLRSSSVTASRNGTREAGSSGDAD
jgi:hypothetical protein